MNTEKPASTPADPVPDCDASVLVPPPESGEASSSETTCPSTPPTAVSSIASSPGTEGKEDSAFVKNSHVAANPATSDLLSPEGSVKLPTENGGVHAVSQRGSHDEDGTARPSSPPLYSLLAEVPWKSLKRDLDELQQGLDEMFSADARETKRPRSEASEASAKPATNSVCIEELRRSCDSYERELLRGIVEPNDLETGYDDVHVKPSTKAALQSLTLAIRHPEEFTYGALARSNHTGVLLYGPPGTGKTMLVKAFARESGATVLEMSAAEILNMYVGEGEKTIRAIFSLARKLHPCVVFIDEVDGLLGKRETCDKRHQRTEMNQFLREWDGLSRDVGKKGAVLMAATNRPFDLDDAVLRRLPRRILVDLPEVEDRAKILHIHLRGETLDPDVKIDEIASSTPFYTGSDLKSLVHSAALHCLEERVAESGKEGGQGLVGPRTIRMEHLLKAKNEIRPATSKEALVAIRDFHARAGNTANLD